ncbi:radical SAM protein [Salicibibacter halophilus]|uniref:Radical SAM protein n=1 Tax=Salicibibacter halophilus TaxID=2502791 RepID=A0A514LMK6_9BACI|nr:radical SAM protein [Salicibibacter halophilus]QDI93094.1 radical SAM protein [Salicibibacter halophilus]
MQSELLYKYPKTILNKGTGFLSGYSHSLNPYTGCAYGCSFCYVRQMPVSTFRDGEWGSWVDVKKGAAELLQKELTRAKKKGDPVTIFMSSSTDPYQPAEHKERITRSLLEVMIDNPPDFFFVQTRSPMAHRDIDLFLRLEDRIRVSMTIETDREDIRKHFTPDAPAIRGRLKTLQMLKEAGVPTQATIAPLLPSSREFPDIVKTHTDRVCIDDYFMGDGSGGRRTANLGIRSKYEELGLEKWYEPVTYEKLLNLFRRVFSDDQIFVSREGFMP